jgi:hypothetical protein
MKRLWQVPVELVLCALFGLLMLMLAGWDRLTNKWDEDDPTA